MSRNTPTKSPNINHVYAQVRENTPISIVEAIAGQLDRQQEAKRRIDEEGVVVRDMKGSVVAHPAIKIEADAARIMESLLSKYMAH